LQSTVVELCGVYRAGDIRLAEEPTTEDIAVLISLG
jgi:hypothetical protein